MALWPIHWNPEIEVTLRKFSLQFSCLEVVVLVAGPCSGRHHILGRRSSLAPRGTTGGMWRSPAVGVTVLSFKRLLLYAVSNCKATAHNQSPHFWLRKQAGCQVTFSVILLHMLEKAGNLVPPMNGCVWNCDKPANCQFESEKWPYSKCMGPYSKTKVLGLALKTLFPEERLSSAKQILRFYILSAGPSLYRYVCFVMYGPLCLCVAMYVLLLLERSSANRMASQLPLIFGALSSC